MIFVTMAGNNHHYLIQTGSNNHYTESQIPVTAYNCHLSTAAQKNKCPEKLQGIYLTILNKSDFEK
jgi:hypothetical protein